MKKAIYIFLIGISISCGSSQEVVTENTKETSVEDATVPTTVPVNKDNNKASESGYVTAQTKPMEIEWLDFETAIDRNKKNERFIFIDVYTDWCGWCKKMDASTFVHKEVVAYMSEHFYAVKMNAESKEPIAYNDVLYEYKQYSPRAGYNTLAYQLLSGRMSFPSFVVLDKKESKRGIIVGYKDAKSMLTELKKFVNQ